MQQLPRPSLRNSGSRHPAPVSPTGTRLAVTRICARPGRPVGIHPVVHSRPRSSTGRGTWPQPPENSTGHRRGRPAQREFSNDSWPAAAKRSPHASSILRVSGQRATPIVSSVMHDGSVGVTGEARVPASGTAELAGNLSRQLKSGLTTPCACSASSTFLRQDTLGGARLSALSVAARPATLLPTSCSHRWRRPLQPAAPLPHP